MGAKRGEEREADELLGSVGWVETEGGGCAGSKSREEAYECASDLGPSVEDMGLKLKTLVSNRLRKPFPAMMRMMTTMMPNPR